MLESATEVDRVINDLKKFINKLPVVAHNGFHFDFLMLERHGLKIAEKYDSMEFAFFAYIFGLTLAWNFGYIFNFTTAIIPAMAVLFFFIGFFLEKLKRNWFVGIRTPWTLSSDIVWEKTHKLGGNLFKIVALISLTGLFFKGGVVVAVMVVPAIIVAIVAIIYSYIEYKKLK
jgi:uncharacterized membrane protein